jgi:hypothetical protein
MILLEMIRAIAHARLDDPHHQAQHDALRVAVCPAPPSLPRAGSS